MILVLAADTDFDSPDYKLLQQHLAELPGITTRVHQVRGILQTLTEIYLLGDTQQLQPEEMEAVPCVERVVRVSHELRIIGLHRSELEGLAISYSGGQLGR